ncbi:hypothetical protein ABH922_003728 [Rhodococcus sp. 27YEA15]|uniref:hypothetical protein n=1 Tax=Rhodococcus sp. 27YEA15 TaxID=3156259 RepID=UPI003C7CE427
MSRTVEFVDRVVSGVVALSVVAIGGGAVVWGTDRFPGMPERLNLSSVLSETDRSWWPWAVGAAGIGLGALSVWWLISHRPARKVKRIVLADHGTGEKVTSDLSMLTSAAADALERSPHVVRARGKAVLDQRVRSVELNVTVRRSAVRSADSIAAVYDTINSVRDSVRHMAQDPSIEVRTFLLVARSGSRSIATGEPATA